ncbi:MAG TPA: hypothetical protein VM327_04315 [Candidatus Thermoplasmatota archaeon]|nr:hypothetical protein [Candidatus Thermoplasmatota archaeon]
MLRTTLVVLSLVLVTALAGCSKAPPSGQLSPGPAALAVDGTAKVDYVAKVRPASQVPNPTAQDALCPPSTAPSQVPHCIDASSSFTIHFMALPAPDGTYEVVLANATGEVPLGALMADANNMWELNKTVDGQDYTGAFDRIELRMGQFVVATSSAAEGDQTFALADGLNSVSATGTYRGKVLNVTVSGLPANTTYSGYLYTMDKESGLLTRGEPFPVVNGPNEYEAPVNIGDYAEFHIHVGSSMVNLLKMTVGTGAA